jgi:hypothetical protein
VGRPSGVIPLVYAKDSMWLGLWAPRSAYFVTAEGEITTGEICECEGGFPGHNRDRARRDAAGSVVAPRALCSAHTKGIDGA